MCEWDRYYQRDQVPRTESGAVAMLYTERAYIINRLMQQHHMYPSSHHINVKGGLVAFAFASLATLMISAIGCFQLCCRCKSSNSFLSAVSQLSLIFTQCVIIFAHLACLFVNFQHLSLRCLAYRWSCYCNKGVLPSSWLFARQCQIH